MRLFSVGVTVGRVFTFLPTATLFFAGDIGQRIFQHPFSWRALGIDVRGRSANLKVCYRTSRQIRTMADHLLPGALRDPDGNEEERAGTISLFDGPVPEVVILQDTEAEVEHVATFLRSAVADGVRPAEIGVFVRSAETLGRARAAVESSGVAEGAVVFIMHLAKGLEFRAVVVMACDQELLPLASRIADAADESDLDDIYETERQLLYVACTRARDRLLITGVAPGSEFLKDLWAQRSWFRAALRNRIQNGRAANRVQDSSQGENLLLVADGLFRWPSMIGRLCVIWKNRPIVVDSRWNRAKSESREFSFEIISEKSWRVVVRILSSVRKNLRWKISALRCFERIEWGLTILMISPAYQAALTHSIVLDRSGGHKADEDVYVLHLIDDAALGSHGFVRLSEPLPLVSRCAKLLPELSEDVYAFAEEAREATGEANPGRCRALGKHASPVWR
jgi:UvrD-like helicase C-terminal domain